MFDRKKMGVQRAYFMMATMFVATSTGADAVVVHTAVDLGGENSEFFQTLFKQLEILVTESEGDSEGDSKSLSQGDMASGMASSTLLHSTPSVIIKGNITDTQRRLTLTFTLHASRSFLSSTSTNVEDDDDDDEEEGWDDDWRSSSGVLTPIVGVVEPYVLSFVELIFNGILSSVISSFLEGSNLLGDVRLV